MNEDCSSELPEAGTTLELKDVEEEGLEWFDARSYATSEASIGSSSSAGSPTSREHSFILSLDITMEQQLGDNPVQHDDAVREAPALELPVSKKARNIETLLDVEVPALVINSPEVDVATKRKVAPRVPAAAAMHTPFSPPTLDQVFVQLVPAADGSDHVRVELAVTPSIFTFGATNLPLAQMQVSHPPDTTLHAPATREPRVTDDTQDDVTHKISQLSIKAADTHGLEASKRDQDFVKEQSKATGIDKKVISGLLSKGSLMPPVDTLIQAEVHVNMILQSGAAFVPSADPGMAPAMMEPGVSSSSANLAAALAMAAASQSWSDRPTPFRGAQGELVLDSLLQATVYDVTLLTPGSIMSSSVRGSAHVNFGVPPLSLGGLELPALQASDSPVLSTREQISAGPQSGMQSSTEGSPDTSPGAADAPVTSGDYQHVGQVRATKLACKTLSRVVCKMVPTFTPPFISRSINEDPRNAAGLSNQPPDVSQQHDGAAEKAAEEALRDELDGLIIDEAIAEVVGSEAAERVWEAQDASASQHDATPAAGTAPVIEYPILTLNGRAVSTSNQQVSVMTETEMIDQLAPGEVFVHVTADMLAALSNKKKRKTEPMVRWAPDTLHQLPHCQDLASSCGGAGTSGAVSTAGTSGGGALISGTASVATSGGGALSMAETSGGGAISYASTSMSGAVTVDIVHVGDSKTKVAEAAMTTPIKPAPLLEQPAEEALEAMMESKLGENLRCRAAQHVPPPAQKGGVARMLCSCFAPSVQE